MRWGPVGCQRGQTTAEYVGLLVVVAAIIAALASADIHGRIVAAVGQAVCVGFSDDPQENCGPEADERFAQAARGDEQQPQDAPTESSGQGQQSPDAAQGAPGLDAAQPPPPAPEEEEGGGGFGDFLAGAGNAAWDAGGDIVGAGEGVVRHVDPFHPNATVDQ